MSTTIKPEERTAMELVASRLGVNADDLFKLIDFESKWNPQAKNPLSSARGLIQFTDLSAHELGFKNSEELVKKYPTIITQLDIVQRYLERYAPYANKQELYMAVFYPAARKWNPLREFGQLIQKVNPGIKTPADYVRWVEGGTKAISTVALVAAAFFFCI